MPLFAFLVTKEGKNTKRNNKYIDQKKYKQSKTNEKKSIESKNQYHNGSHES
jgi:hypothetical protein